MRKAFPAATFILALSFSALAGVVFIGLSKANPTPELDFPTNPILTSPTIVVHSPAQNQSYSPTDLWFNFTIIKPEAWIQPSGKYGGVDPNGNPFYDILGNVTSVYFVVDGGKRQYVPVQDTSYIIDAFPKYTLNFSIHLTLAEGVYSVSVGCEADSCFLVMDIYTPENATGLYQPGLEIPVGLSSTVVYGASDVIDFTVAKPPETETFPATLALVGSGMSIFGVAVCIFCY